MNLNIYTEEMAKSIWDKAFFMDKIIGAKLVIDFGCADGAMIRMLSELFPNITFYGYDHNDDLIEMAWSKVTSENYKNVYFFHENRSPWEGATDGFEDMLKIAKEYYKPEEICINFSSVLHEIFSSTGGKDKIVHMIDELHPKYITIRDMYYHHEILDEEDEYLSELQKIHIISLCSALAPGCYNKYINKFGYIKKMKDLVHFLMKYQWRDNDYEQELKENYFAWRIRDVKKLVGNYNTIFEAHYMLPYYVEQWKIYGIGPDVHTHAQFILRRND